MNVPRFYQPQSLDAAEAVLDGSEAHHLLHVLRLRPGDQVELFDGKGIEATARIEKAGKRQVHLAILSQRTVQKPLPAVVILATAPPKGERFRSLVEKATELGVSRLVPLRTAHSVVDPRETKLDKMRSVVIAACKQSRRSHLMEVASPVSWEEFLEQEPPESRMFIADHGGEPWRTETISGAERVTLCIGPEAGFTRDELSQAEASAQRITLGPHLLRIETAAMAMATLAVTSLFSRQA